MARSDCVVCDAILRIGGEGVKLPIEKIVIPPDRHRKQFQNIDSLAQSIQEVGLIHPVVVERETSRLVAGERRLRACKMLGWSEIPVTFKEDLDEWTIRAIELEENIKRENLTYGEEVEAKLRLHELYQERYGTTVEGRKGGHRLVDTAELLGEAEGLTKMDIQLARAIREKPELANKDTKSAAYKAMKAGEELGLRSQIAAILAADSQEEKPVKVILGDSLEVLKGYDDDFFDFAVIDPPYLVGIDKSHDLGKTWDVRVDGDPEANAVTVTGIFKELYRVLRPGAHCYVFFAMMRYGETMEMLKEAGLWHSPIPLIWIKTKVPPLDPYHTFASRYEPIFYCTKGKPRAFVSKLLPDNVFEFPTPNPKTHPTEKPVGLIKALIELASVEKELGVDCFAGSGTFGVACQELNRRALLIEKDPEYFELAWERINASD